MDERLEANEPLLVKAKTNPTEERIEMTRLANTTSHIFDLRAHARTHVNWLLCHTGCVSSSSSSNSSCKLFFLARAVPRDGLATVAALVLGTRTRTNTNPYDTEANAAG
jgi:hypothetical protein